MRSLICLAFSFALSSSVSAQQAALSTWKYDLRPGDHLVYNYTFEREFSGTVENKTRSQFINHVVVVAEQKDRLSIGFQRNRQSAELLYYREKGHDKLSKQLPEFQKRLARRPVRFSEANEFTLSGTGLNYWQTNRESPSRILFAIHEIETLPEQAVKPGDTWAGGGLLKWNFEFVAFEKLDGKMCDRVEAKASQEGSQLVYWWCPEERLIHKLTFEGEYPVGDGARVRERVIFELKDRRRNESLESWLQAPDTQQAAMQGLLLSPWAGLSSTALALVAQASDPDVLSEALAISLQRKLPFPHYRLVQLSSSSDPPVKRMVTELLEPNTEGVAANCANDGCKLPAETYTGQRLGTSFRVLPDKTGDQLFMMHVPLDYRGDRPFPLLIYLSGGAGFAIDGVNTAEDVVSHSPYLVLYPQAGGQWWAPEIAARVDVLLKHVLEEFNVDTNRVYIAGFSNGGTGALDYATLWPQRFAAVVSLMGAGQCISEISGSLSNVAEIPILFLHGDKDHLIPVDCTKNTYEAVSGAALGARPELHILKGREHDITLQDDDGLTLAFLERQAPRQPFPRHFTARWSDLAYARRYWVEILDKADGPATVDAQVEKGNTLELTTQGVRRIRVLLAPELLTGAHEIRIILNRKELYRGPVAHDCGLLENSSRGAADRRLGYDSTKDFSVPQ